MIVGGWGPLQPRPEKGLSKWEAPIRSPTYHSSSSISDSAIDAQPPPTFILHRRTFCDVAFFARRTTARSKLALARARGALLFSLPGLLRSAIILFHRGILRRVFVFCFNCGWEWRFRQLSAELSLITHYGTSGGWKPRPRSNRRGWAGFT